MTRMECELFSYLYHRYRAHVLTQQYPPDNLEQCDKMFGYINRNYPYLKTDEVTLLLLYQISTELCDFYSIQSVLRFYSFLDRMFQWAMPNGLASHNPVASSGQNNTDVPFTHYSPKQLSQIEQLISYTAYEDFFRFLLHFDLSATRAAKLPKQQIELDSHVLLLPHRKSTEQFPVFLRRPVRPSAWEPLKSAYDRFPASPYVFTEPDGKKIIDRHITIVFKLLRNYSGNTAICSRNFQKHARWEESHSL